MRGGPGPGPLSNSSQNSLQSSGGWVVPAEEEAAMAEEMLKQELKKAKVYEYCVLLSGRWSKLCCFPFFSFDFAEKDQEAAENARMAAH